MSIPKLSDAIRLGAMMRPQAHGPNDWPERSCAYQAALDATGCEFNDTNLLNKARNAWPWLLRMERPCPVCGKCLYGGSVLVAVYHLNDSHKWTREKIAFWISTIEPQDEAQPSTESQPEAKEAVCLTTS